MDASLRDWAGLPVHILDSIVIMLDGWSDYIRFSSVCQEWRSVASEASDNKVKLQILKESRKKLPMLMFTTDENYESWGLYSVQEGKTYNVKLPSPYKYRFLGSCRGWLFCIDKKTLVVTLVNPINNRCISLPPFIDYDLFRREWHKKYFDYYIRKAIYFSDPDISPCGFGVVVFYRGPCEVAFFKSGDLSWNFMNSDTNNPDPSRSLSEDDIRGRDIIYYKGKVYVVGAKSELVEIDITTKTMKTIIPSNDYSWSYWPYLVESQDGELLLVKRFSYAAPASAPHDEEEVSEDEEEVPDDEEEVSEDEAEVSKNEEEVSDEEEEVSDDEEEVSDIDGLDPSLENESTSSSDSEVGPSDRQEALDCNYPKCSNFKVFKMIHPSDPEASATWLELGNLGKQALFVGDNYSVSVSTVEFPNCVDNYIYYTTRQHHNVFPYVYKGDDEDCFVFDLEGKGFHHHHKLDDASKYLQPPIWYVPNPEDINLGART